MNRKRLIWLLLCTLGLVMCCYGVWRGEAATVLIKGSRICMECIGLG